MSLDHEQAAADNRRRRDELPVVIPPLFRRWLPAERFVRQRPVPVVEEA